MRKLRIGEFTCTCSAYSFPHRMGGGKCSGICVVEDTWYKNYGLGICSGCSCHSDFVCEVVQGQEDVKECRAFEEFINFNEIKI